jgi:hypothetical protein
MTFPPDPEEPVRNAPAVPDVNVDAQTIDLQDFWTALATELSGEQEETEPYWIKRHSDMAMRLKDSVRYPNGVWHDEGIDGHFDSNP